MKKKSKAAEKRAAAMAEWQDIGSDGSWDVHGGIWAKKGPDGAWYVLKFENMIEACGERDAAEMGFVYWCGVRRVDLREVTSEQLQSAQKCVGVSKDDIREDFREQALVYALVSYGQYAPLDEITGSAKCDPGVIRDRARARAEVLMRDRRERDEALDRSVNAIGSTARDFGQGDINAGLRRYVSSGKLGTDPVKDLMVKLTGRIDD